MARRLGEQLAQPVIVDNRPGANGLIGGELAAKAPPDGYTLLVAVSADALNAGLLPRMPFSLTADFAAVSPIATTAFVLVTHPGVPARSARELVVLARARPGALNYATFGSAGIPNLAVEMMKSSAGIRMEQIAYKGSGPALGDVVAEGWNGVLAPAATPSQIVSRLNEEIGKAVKHEEVNRQLVEQSYQPAFASPAAFGAFLKAEVEKWTRVIKAAGIRPQ